MTSESAYQVVVVGAGPVGLATAVGLARRGIRVGVVEAALGVSHGSRAICVSRHSLEVLDRLGAGQAVEDHALPWTVGRSFFRDHEVLAFEMPEAEHDTHPPMVNISQSVLEQLLVDTAEATPGVELLWGVRLADVKCTEDSAVVSVDTSSGMHRIPADWVVAADGARSDTRRLLGLSMRGTSYEGRYVIADIHWPASLPTGRRVWFDPDSSPGSTIIMHRQPGDIWRIDYQLRPDEDTEAELAPERIRERVTRHLAWLGIDSPWTLEWSSLYRAHSLSLDDYVHDRVLFAGDAAHLVPIFGVRGLNSGLEDADTLAWQLAAVVHGTAEARLLTAYSAERRAAWAQNIAAAEKSTRIMSPEGTGFPLTRDALLALSVHHPEFRPLIDPRQTSATHAFTSPLTWPPAALGDGLAPGSPLADQAVTLPGGRPSTLFAHLGSGFAVIGVDVGEAELAPISARLADAFAPEPVQTVVAGRGGIELADAALGSPGDVLVVRPDRLVLCRVSEQDRDRLADLASALVRGTAPGKPARLDSAEPPESPGERVWLSLSAALDETPDPTAFLTRLALVLGSWVDGATFAQALESSGR
ncbi:FAD-dependent monooxygenase [Amycolatopsis rhabdoformis]|uniref:FAD-dependent monooxygenase n=1 Tax=Amycolatopsis rhabdoformis TaxID=1448059 RepID=A0ABZ1IDF0_9PSEU|nr:FAD-dependent monooxygenase [Amycolatopsis rhabdoformis]WSE32490.1 FAD-dependent monooxygenase [Amycolatopsis rhabdoformis]